MPAPTRAAVVEPKRRELEPGIPSSSAVRAPSLAPQVTSSSTTRVEIDGRTLLTFGGCDYLGLAHHPAVVAAAAEAMRVYGLSVTASRVTTGNAAAHVALERDVAALLGQEAACALPEGYMANLALAQALASGGAGGAPAPVALIDERAHRSVSDSARAAGLEIVRFRHRDAGDAGGRLRAIAGPVAIMTDGVFTADGSVAPVAELLLLLRDGRDVLVVDDCHGVGVLGGGRGTCREAGLDDPRVVLTTTLAKGVGCYGGAVAGTHEVVDRVRHRATAFICTTPIPPAMAAAASAAIEIIAGDPARNRRLLANARRLRDSLGALGLSLAEQPTPIAAFLAGDEARMERVHAALLAAGILAPLIRYPGGPAERYFRLTVTAEHTPADIERLCEAMGRALRLA